MSALLRKVKSTISAGTSERNNGNGLDATGQRDKANNNKILVTKSRLQKAYSRPEILGDDESNNSTNKKTALEQQNQLSPDLDLQQQHNHPLTQFRRRLARKASTFSLRSKRWKGEAQQRDYEEQKVDTESGTVRRHLGHHLQQPQEPKLRRGSVAEIVEDQDQDPAGIQIESDRQSHSSSDTVLRREATATTPKACSERERAAPTSTAGDSVVASQPSSQHDSIFEEQRGHFCVDQAGGKTLTNMASDHTAAPPVPYTRLKEITEDACEAALADVKAYSHPDTESWNTTIINSILGALVEETSQKSASGSGPAQPQFKYIVNSTIIQHAAASSTPGDDGKKTSGRRGMHAASGAYWNNEKDGMWSYKYPGADSKGLDVVIGIIWIWVG
ncbi:hypothetical protein ABEF93_005211 [Exophiala dermatitidis]